MPRTPVAIFDPALTGTNFVPTAIDQPNGMIVPNFSASMRLEIKNTAGSTLTVTLKKLPCPTCGDTTDRTVTIATTATADVGKLNPAIFGQADGSLWVDFSAGAAGTIAALR